MCFCFFSSLLFLYLSLPLSLSLSIPPFLFPFTSLDRGYSSSLLLESYQQYLLNFAVISLLSTSLTWVILLLRLLFYISSASFPFPFPFPFHSFPSLPLFAIMSSSCHLPFSLHRRLAEKWIVSPRFISNSFKINTNVSRSFCSYRIVKTLHDGDFSTTSTSSTPSPSLLLSKDTITPSVKKK